MNDADLDKTRPPQGALRYPEPRSLYAAIPRLSELTHQSPYEGETTVAFLSRLRSSTTPEEAVPFTAFATLPQMAIWWGHECLRLMPEHLDASDRDMMERGSGWIARPTTATRFAIMREALFANGRGPGVLLGLAVGWSGGPIAPNDPAPVANHRAPTSLTASILSCLARAEYTQRPIYLARCIDMAESLFRVN